MIKPNRSNSTLPATAAVLGAADLAAIDGGNHLAAAPKTKRIWDPVTCQWIEVPAC
jgi:hypothetical protein